MRVKREHGAAHRTVGDLVTCGGAYVVIHLGHLGLPVSLREHVPEIDVHEILAAHVRADYTVLAGVQQYLGPLGIGIGHDGFQFVIIRIAHTGSLESCF
ncbi:hypothetical protein SDC9_209820 [bioreactor metagenome]|uniref:Uncharacterized protein n=1 Tax=bioreactor metagenome TaxID=1076179 RepID=A0A645JP46_9ZZZZ